MKKFLLPAIILIAGFLCSSATAQVLFNPDFSSGATPTGYSTTTASGGSIVYSGNTMTSSDFL